MAKPTTRSPYYHNEEGKNAILQLKKDFVFDEKPKNPTFVIIAAAPPGYGKTHLACTMSDFGPVYVLDTEYRAHMVVSKFKRVQFKRVRSYPEMVAAIGYILKHCEPGTIVLDSGTDCQGFAETEYLERTGKTEVGMPYNWGEIYWMTDSPIYDIKQDGRFNVFLTARVKDEYKKDKATGKQIPHIYKGFPYKADVSLIMDNPREGRFLKTPAHGNCEHLNVRFPVGADMQQILTIATSDRSTSTTQQHKEAV